MIEVLTTGLANTVQDLGRSGYLDMGVSRSGAMDRFALETGNALLGNAPGAAAVEVAIFPFRLRFHRDLAFAITGADCRATLDDEALPPWWVRAAKPGQLLTLGAPRRGARVYLAFAGGVDVPVVLGSRSTDAKSAFGGFSGRGLRRGDRLACGPAAGTAPRRSGFGVVPPTIEQHAASPRPEPIAVRVLPAAEHEAFGEQALAAFAHDSWAVTREANRTGYRLEGPALPLREKLELRSHGVMPGVVQVPPSGQPIVQLAEANTCGGYPKIAAVIAADLWKLGQMRPGERVRFVEVERKEAIQALRDLQAEIASIRQAAELFREG